MNIYIQSWGLKKVKKTLSYLFIGVIGIILFTNNVNARVYYYDMTFDSVGTDLNIFEEFLTVSGQNNNGKHALGDLVLEKGVGTLNYFSDIFNTKNSSSIVFDAIGFVEPSLMRDYFLKSMSAYTSINSYIGSAMYGVILWENPRIEGHYSSTLRINDDGCALILFDKDMNYLTHAYRSKKTYQTSGNDQYPRWAYVDYNNYLKNNIWSDDDGNQSTFELSNYDVTPLLQMLFATRPGFTIRHYDTDDRYLIQYAYVNHIKYSVAGTSNYGWWKKIFHSRSVLEYKLYNELTLGNYIAKAFISNGVYVPPFTNLFETEMNGIDDEEFTSFESVNISDSDRGYFFVPISNENYSAEDIKFHFYRTNNYQSLITSSLGAISGGSLVEKAKYISYPFTYSTYSSYSYYTIYGYNYTKDINLSTSKGVTYNFDYHNDIIYMYTDYTTASFYVYYDPTKYKVVKSISSGTGSISWYDSFTSYMQPSLYDSINGSIHDFVGYSGSFYELGSVSYDGVYESGYDNWSDCIENNCIENSVSWSDDVTQTNLWDRDNWNSLNDITSSAWSNIQSFLGILSLPITMFNTLFSGLPSIISSAFLFIFVLGITLILLKILL